MEQLSQYQTVINNIPIENNAPSMTSTIQSVLSKANFKMKDLTQLLFPYAARDSLLLENEKGYHKPRLHLIKKSSKKRRQMKMGINNTMETSSDLINNNEPSLPLNSSQRATRNKAHVCYLNSSLDKNNSNSFNKTHLNQSSCTKSTTITHKKKKLPKLCLLLHYNTKGTMRNEKNHIEPNSTTNKSSEAFMLSFPSPNPFSLNEINVNTTNISRFKHLFLSSKQFKKQCAVIENKCHSVDREVKRYPIKLKEKKKKINKLLNESNETINDLTDSKTAKVDRGHILNMSVKTKRVLRETDWIHRMHPDLALEANKTLRDMFSIKPNDKRREYIIADKQKIKFDSNINQMVDLINKNFEANKKCNEYLSKIHLTRKVKVKVKAKPKEKQK